MKRLHYLAIIACMFFTTAARAQANTALQFNDAIASITDSLYAKGQAWGGAFNAAFATKDYSSLKPLREDMGRFINRNVAAVTNMKDVKNSKPMRMAMVDFLNFELKMVQEFRAFEPFTAGTTNETISAAIEHLKIVAAEEDSHLKAVAATQDTYATENGFTIAPAKAGSE